MNYKLNREAQTITLDLSYLEFDMIQVFKMAALNRIQPMNPDSDLYQAYRELERLNYEVFKERSQT